MVIMVSLHFTLMYNIRHIGKFLFTCLRANRQKLLKLVFDSKPTSRYTYNKTTY